MSARCAARGARASLPVSAPLVALSAAPGVQRWACRALRSRQRCPGPARCRAAWPGWRSPERPRAAPRRPSVSYEGKRVMVSAQRRSLARHRRHPAERRAGRHATCDPGSAGGAGAKHWASRSRPKQYTEQRLTVAPSKVDLSAEGQRARRARDSHVHECARDLRSERLPASLRLLPPVHGVRTSSFGSRRVFNNEPRAPHSGMDIAAATGTPIHAAADGTCHRHRRLLLQRQHGLVDHGEGLITMYCHLSAIGVQWARAVRRGAGHRQGRRHRPRDRTASALRRGAQPPFVDPALFLPRAAARLRALSRS